nr:hypothetical protein [Tanacetum cinerariifolium]
MSTPVFVDPEISTQADGAQSPRVLVPFPEDTYEAIKQAYLFEMDIVSEPVEDPVETKTPVMAHTAVRVPPAMSHGLSARIEDVAAISIKHSVRCLGDEEEDDEIEENLDSDSESEDTKDEGPVEVGFDNFRGEGEEIENCDGKGGRVNSIFGRGGGSLAICSIESKDGLEGGRLVGVGGRSSSVSKIAWGEAGGVENKSSMGSMLIANEECLDGWVGASGGEVKGGGVDLGLTKSLLRKTPGESGSKEFRVDGGAV